MAYDPHFLSPGLDKMIELAAVAWQSSPKESLLLLRRFQIANRAFQCVVLAHRHAAALVAQANEAGGTG